jgi:hypothetical protein
MTERIRHEYDADRIEALTGATRLQTAENTRQINCGTCGDKYFVDQVMFESITRAIKAGNDNPFICPRCEEAYQEIER